MLLAASESAVTKKPRLRLTMRRSSSVRPLGSSTARCRASCSFLAASSGWRRWRGIFPGPLVLEGHQLVDVGLAVDDALVGRVDAAWCSGCQVPRDVFVQGQWRRRLPRSSRLAAWRLSHRRFWQTAVQLRAYGGDGFFVPGQHGDFQCSDYESSAAKSKALKRGAAGFVASSAWGRASCMACPFPSCVSWAYWQASQPGSSMAQNFTSVAGGAAACALPQQPSGLPRRVATVDRWTTRR